MFRKSEVEKADILGPRLVGAATETASIMFDRLIAFAGEDEIVLAEDFQATQFIIEIMVFYMHLVDRLAFVILGAHRRELFADRFIVAIVKEVLLGLSKDISADDFGIALRATYNSRQQEYAQYKRLIPEKDQPQKDTLFWEVSKRLFGFLNDMNPATLIFVNLLVAESASVFVKHAAKVEEVLSA